MQDYIKILRSSNLFDGILPEEIGAMLVCLDAKVSNYQKDEFVQREGDDIDSIGLVLDGSVLVIQEDMWGNRNIVERVSTSQTFTTAFACARGSVLNVSVVAGKSTKIMFLNVQKILTVCTSSCSHHNKIIRNLISELAESDLHLSERMTHLNKRTTREKIMSYLSSQSNIAGGREFDIPFSRQQMADYLSVERSGLSLELGKMKKEGLIEFNKNHFVVKG